jgi:predicted nucleotidyltransferase
MSYQPPYTITPKKLQAEQCLFRNGTDTIFRTKLIGYLMRLSDFQKHTICESAKHNFGQDTQVWLFGSRVDDLAKGGDIDLYIEPQMQKPADLITAKLEFLRDLHKQKIDVVLHRADSAVELPIYRIAKQTGVLLQ